MSYQDPYKDIFGVAQFRTSEARLKEFHSFYAQLYNLGLLNLQFSVTSLLFHIERGFLSPQSASYFLAGRASSVQVDKFRLFSSMYDFLREKGFTDFQILKSWQQTKTSAVEVENTFLFPLAELDCSEDFSEVFRW